MLEEFVHLYGQAGGQVKVFHITRKRLGGISGRLRELGSGSLARPLNALGSLERSLVLDSHMSTRGLAPRDKKALIGHCGPHSIMDIFTR